ncbi:hypothetical protein K470DRAFT_215668 [Piedraia hortae CBS 480.64]|uniref:HOOK N-terminal domain-containing protein n=1 Tax=Piedraia hortae CBS 480.64 TaxID=1314780 RepID=A0A6A7C2L7_9PEZI|nr:hypothetical protein K470DRAFT_215668 [Piedraia hortae CBS 480.64]
MDEADAGLGESLLKWVNSFEKVEGWEQLSDGRCLWRTLRHVDPEYFAAALPEPDVGPGGDWTRKWQNLKHVERRLSTYHRDVCHEQPLPASFVPDLQAIASRADAGELQKLIMAVIRSAMASPQSNQSMSQRLMGLGREHAMAVANRLRVMEEPLEQDLAQAYRDPLLEREEELFQAQATISQLQDRHEAARRQLHELRQDKERLQEAFETYRSEMQNGKFDDPLRKLQRQAENDRAYIEDLEQQMQTSRQTIAAYEKQLERNRSGDSVCTLRNEIQQLRAENAQLEHTAKANENLKKKIHALQEQEKGHAAVREELGQARERLEELQQLKQAQAGLEKEIIEKRNLIRNQEYQINELTTTRKHAEHEARLLAQKLEAARERLERDQETSLDGDEDKAALERELESTEARLKRITLQNAQLEERLRQQEEKPPAEGATETDATALQRENRLMATAWYELARKVNNQQISTRRKEPRSWIRQQRLQV